MCESPLPLETSCRDVKVRLDAGDDLLLLDCRENEEYAIARIEPSILIPTSQWKDRVGELQDYRDRHIVVYCHLGGRSLQVANWMRQNGFQQVQSMAGGIDQWAVEIDPTLPRY